MDLTEKTDDEAKPRLEKSADDRVREFAANEKRGGTRKKRMATIAYPLLIVLSLILFVHLGPSIIPEAGPGLASLAKFLLGTFFLLFLPPLLAVPLFSRGQGSDRGEGIPSVALKLFLAGLAIFGAGVIYIFAVITIFPLEQRTDETFFLFIGLVSIGMGFAISGSTSARMIYTRRRFKVPQDILDSLRQMEPDAFFETKTFHVLRKSGIHILLKKQLWGVHFVRLFKQAPVSDNKVKMPYTSQLWGVSARSLKYEVNGLRMAKVRGEFTIPTEITKLGEKAETKYARGSGILYYVSLYPVGHFEVNLLRRSLCGKLDKPTIIRIMDDLSKERAAELSR
jgi:hypothetical protein